MEEKTILTEIRILSNLIRQKLWSNPQAKIDGELIGGHGYILKYLAENQENGVFQRDIEKVFKIRRSTVTQTLNRMEENGIVIRKSVEHDNRLKKIELTPKGRQIHLSFKTRAENFEKEVSKALTEKERQKFLDLVKKLQLKVEEQSL